MRLKSLCAAAAALMLLASSALAATKSGVVTITVQPSVQKDSSMARLWLPYPFATADQTIRDMQVFGNQNTSGVYSDPVSGANYLFAEWLGLPAQPMLTMSFHVDSNYSKRAALRDSGEPIPTPIRERYLKSDEFVPAKDFAEVAAKITKGKKGVLEKARAVYDWTVDNTFRDPDVKGCGLGVPGKTMGEAKGGGKCADISSVFVAVARAASVPARDVYGLRLADPKSGDITSAYHCWAEFYLPGTGWVPVDPADVRKMMLTNKLELGDKDAAMWREFFWGGDDLLRIALNRDSRGVVFTPAQAGEPVNYFMYPFAQVDGQSLNYFDPKAFGYSVSFKADE